MAAGYRVHYDDATRTHGPSFRLTSLVFALLQVHRPHTREHVDRLYGRERMPGLVERDPLFGAHSV